VCKLFGSISSIKIKSSISIMVAFAKAKTLLAPFNCAFVAYLAPFSTHGSRAAGEAAPTCAAPRAHRRDRNISFFQTAYYGDFRLPPQHAPLQGSVSLFAHDHGRGGPALACWK
jgi:hypothetical protein